MNEKALGENPATRREPWQVLAADLVDPKDPLGTEWGYLVIDADGSFYFDSTTRPPDAEIIESDAYQAIVRNAGAG